MLHNLQRSISIAIGATLAMTSMNFFMSTGGVKMRALRSSAWQICVFFAAKCVCMALNSASTL
eukprot:13212852-Ditylum_brightwellii.AAC.1